MKRFKPAVLILCCIPLAGAMVHPDAVQRWRLASGPGLATPDGAAEAIDFAAQIQGGAGPNRPPKSWSNSTRNAGR